MRLSLKAATELAALLPVMFPSQTLKRLTQRPYVNDLLQKLEARGLIVKQGHLYVNLTK